MGGDGDGSKPVEIGDWLWWVGLDVMSVVCRGVGA
jgi:hypothetical protein